MAKKHNKIKGNIVYSTDENFNYDFGDEAFAETLPKSQQQLKIQLLAQLVFI